MVTLNLACEESADDGSENDESGAVFLVATLVAMAGGGRGAGNHTAFRFPSVSGMAGVTVTSAILEWKASASDTGSFSANWFGQLAESPGILTTTGFNISDTGQRPRTVKVVRGNNVDFGDWAFGATKTFSADLLGNTLVEILQEIIDAGHDPDAFVLLHINLGFGSGTRNPYTFDHATEPAPKFTVIHDAATTDQTMSPTPPGPTTEVPDATIVAVGVVSRETTPPGPLLQVPLATIVGAGTVTREPTPPGPALVVPTATLVAAGEVVLAPESGIVDAISEGQEISGGGTLGMSPLSADPTLVVPDATLVGVGAVVRATVPPGPVLTVPQAILVAVDALVLAPTPPGPVLTVPQAVLTALLATAAPAPGAATLFVPQATISGGAVDDFVPFGVIEWTIGAVDHPVGTLFFLRATLKTFQAAAPVSAKLFDITMGQYVTGAIATSTSLAPEEVYSTSSFTLDSARHRYRVDFGGEPGTIYTIYDAGVVVEVTP